MIHRRGRSAVIACALLLFAGARAQAVIQYTPLGPDPLTPGTPNVNIDFNAALPTEVMFAGLVTSGFNPGDGSNINAIRIQITNGANAMLHNGALAAGDDIDDLLGYGNFPGGVPLTASDFGQCSGSFCPTGVNHPPGNPGAYHIGPWGGGVLDAYLGVKFDLGGNTHFGWVHLIVSTAWNPFSFDSPTLFGTVTGYAWETTPDQAIKAGAVPEPASLALLAAGALVVGRRLR